MIKLSRAITNPEHMSGGVIPTSRRAIDTGHSFFIPEEQSLMARIIIRCCHLRRTLRCHAAGFHKVHGVRNFITQDFVTLGLFGLTCKAQGPFVDITKISITAC